MNDAGRVPFPSGLRAGPPPDPGPGDWASSALAGGRAAWTDPAALTR